MPKKVPFWQAVPPLPLSRSGALNVRGINFSRFRENPRNPRKIDAREKLMIYSNSFENRLIVLKLHTHLV